MTTDYDAIREALDKAHRNQMASLEAIRDRWANDYAALYAENAALRAALIRAEAVLGEYPELPESAAPRPLPVLGGLHPGAGEPAQDPSAGVRSTVQQ